MDATTEVIPPGAARVLTLMQQGRTLHGGPFGMFLMGPLDARCTNVNHHTARAMIRRGLIRKHGGVWIAALANDKFSEPNP